MTWNEFYHNRVNNKEYEKYFGSRYSILLDFLKSEIKTDKIVLEVGCGTGLITKCIYNDNIEFTASDMNNEMLKLTELNLTNKKVKIERKDIRNKLDKHLNTIYSHGVLEHFSENEVSSIINNQLQVADKLIHYVPTNRYHKKSFGDENLLSTKQWNRIVKPSEIIEFNQGYDAILVWMNK